MSAILIGLIARSCSCGCLQSGRFADAASTAGTPVLSFGTAGCNLTCKFCQNWDISKATQFDRLQAQASPNAIARAAKELGARSVG
jgi:pyruvate-formate lyase-activating enzyme